MKKNNFFWMAVVTIILLIIIFISSYLNQIYHYYPNAVIQGYWADYGTFINGFLGIILSIATVTFIIFNYLEQKEQNRKQNEYYKEQKIENEKNIFNTQFYHLVNNFNNLILNLSIEIDNGKKKYSNVNVLKYLCNQYTKIYNQPEERLLIGSQSIDRENINEIVRFIHKLYGSNLYQLFSNINYIFHFIHAHKQLIKNVSNSYVEYFKINIPTYLNFLLALYAIYLPQNKFKLPRIIIKRYRPFKISDFENYIKPDYFEEFKLLFQVRLGTNETK